MKGLICKAQQTGGSLNYQLVTFNDYVIIILRFVVATKKLVVLVYKVDNFRRPFSLHFIREKCLAVVFKSLVFKATLRSIIVCFFVLVNVRKLEARQFCFCICKYKAANRSK